MILTRRSLIGAGLAGLAGPALAEAVPASLLFDIYRKGSRIGANEVRFREAERGFTVDTLMTLAVKVAFVTVYTYRQEGRERWRDGQLVGSEVTTDDDGDLTRVSVREQGGALAVDGAFGRYTVPLGTMTDLSFWNTSITGAAQLIDAQHGELMKLRVIPPVQETVQVLGRPVPATRYGFIAAQTRAGTAREGTIWYDQDGRWVRGILKTRGETLTLELRG